MKLTEKEIQAIYETFDSMSALMAAEMSRTYNGFLNVLDNEEEYKKSEWPKDPEGFRSYTVLLITKHFKGLFDQWDDMEDALYEVKNILK